jgi:hypothetical protein
VRAEVTLLLVSQMLVSHRSRQLDSLALLDGSP